MKEKMILIAICMTIIFCMSACSGNTMNSGENQNAVTEISTSEKDESADDEAIGDSTMIMMNGDITIQMSMYGGFEQVGSIGQSLPRDDKQTTTSSGDIVLYSGNQMVVFYGSNSWSYTRLGHISDKDEAEMADLLSQGDVTITISTEDNV